MSHHDKKGRFTSKANAHTVSKGGERYKVVRQLRRMKPKKRRSDRERATEALQRENRQLQRFALLGALSAPGWVNVHEAFDRAGLGEAKMSHKDAQVEAALSDPYSAASTFGVEFDAGGTLEDRAEEVAYALGYEEAKLGRPMAWTKDLLSWAKKKGFRKVRSMYDGGREDGGG